MHELSESTKRIIDGGSFALAATAAGVRALTLSDMALIIAIISGLMSIAWQAWRFYDRYKYGPRTVD